MKRILALDVGSKTIGVAVSDPMGWTAQGVTTLQRGDGKREERELLDLIRRFDVEEILIGLPINMNGTEGPQAQKMRKYAAYLEGVVPVPIKLWDERLTTVGAERSLLEADLSREKRRTVINKMAAVFLLQGYLDYLHHQSRDGGSS